MHVDAVSVGVFLKSDRKVVEVRPGARTVVLHLYLPRPVEGGRLRVVTRRAGDRVVHRLSLRGPDDLDAEVLQWLCEAYALATDADPGHDPEPEPAPAPTPAPAPAEVSAPGTR